MKRMRTIPQAAAYMQEIDPGTALTKTAIRRLVLEGKLPFTAVGTKRLVAIEDLESYLEAGDVVGSTSVMGEIRRLEVRA
ncbi:MAG: excisionase family DNA-binding protein [Ruminiclostridium sp.]|nr:excisionase family DNA-binding protein [Ruminiclostridium sp.]